MSAMPCPMEVAQAEANGDRRLMDAAIVARQIAATEALMGLPIPGYLRVALRTFHATFDLTDKKDAAA